MTRDQGGGGSYARKSPAAPWLHRRTYAARAGHFSATAVPLNAWNLVAKSIARLSHHARTCSALPIFPRYDDRTTPFCFCWNQAPSSVQMRTALSLAAMMFTPFHSHSTIPPPRPLQRSLPRTLARWRLTQRRLVEIPIVHHRQHGPANRTPHTLALRLGPRWTTRLNTMR